MQTGEQWCSPLLITLLSAYCQVLQIVFLVKWYLQIILINFNYTNTSQKKKLLCEDLGGREMTI